MTTENNKMWPNIPPKDIANAIHGTCFDYQDWDKLIDGLTVEQRVYNCWQRMHGLLLDDGGRGQWFIDHVRENQPANEIVYGHELT